MPPAEAYGVASFYALINLQSPCRRTVHVCDDIACRTRGADAICNDLEEQFGAEGVRREDSATAWHRSPCLGLCERGTAVFCETAGSEPVTIADAASQNLVHLLLHPEIPVPRRAESTFPGEQLGTSLPLLSRAAMPPTPGIDAYRFAGGYLALRRALQIGPEGVLAELTASRLTGRGGAGFPTWMKWKAVAEAVGNPRYVVCNGDESEPGTFKDRILMELDPFAVIEAMTIAGFATSAEHGFIYIRAEYPEAAEAIELAIKQSRSHGMLGSDILNHDLNFDIEVRRGAGAYICGEETALLNSIEGKRGEPRTKPPFPVQHGLFGRPTVINSVETLLNVLPILMYGGDTFAESARGGVTGSRLFCLSGCVSMPGIYEAQPGATLRELIDRAGGTPDNTPIHSVLVGGAAGSFVRGDEMDIELTPEGARSAGISIGSGVIMVFDETIDMANIVKRIARFFRDESCGQCVPCRVGTVRVEELIERFFKPGADRDAEIALFNDLALAMKDASICGLGQTATIAIASTFSRLRMNSATIT